MKNIFKTALFATLVLSVASCSQYSFEPEEGTAKGEKIESTISIAALKTTYMTTTGYFTADKIESNTRQIVNGIVTSTDIEGNVYKYIAVQEEGGEAIRISVDASGISSLYPVGQRVSVVLNDLYVGKYGESPQVGIYYKRPKDGRISPGAIPMPIARQKIIAYGEPEPEAVVADTMTIAEIKATPRSAMDYRLVCIKNASFTGKGFDNRNNPVPISADQIFAPGTNGIGFPQAREIIDATGSIAIATSEFAKFAQQPLPASTYKGHITVIASWYSTGSGAYQLTLRTLSDLGTGFDGYLNQIKYTRKY